MQKVIITKVAEGYICLDKDEKEQHIYQTIDEVCVFLKMRLG